MAPRAEAISDDYGKLRIDIKMFKTDMIIAMGDATDNVSQHLKELDAELEAGQKKFEDKVNEVRGTRCHMQSIAF